MNYHCGDFTLTEVELLHFFLTKIFMYLFKNY